MGKALLRPVLPKKENMHIGGAKNLARRLRISKETLEREGFKKPRTLGQWAPAKKKRKKKLARTMDTHNIAH